MLNKKLLDCYSSPDTTEITKFWAMRGEEYVARMWEDRNTYTRFWLGRLKGRDDFENLILYGDVI